MRSMTGYSKINFEDDSFKIKVELKSVNNKYLNLNLKYPYILNYMDGKLRSMASNYVTRGHVEVRIEFRDKRTKEELLEYDENFAKNYMTIMNKIEKQFGEEIPDKLTLMVKNPSIISKKDDDEDDDSYNLLILSKFEEALKKLNEMRASEADRLKIYILERLDVIEKTTLEIKSLKDLVAGEYRAKLINRIKNIEANIEYSEEELLKEMLLFADKADISEEISRLESHILHFKKELNSENVGKKLDFIIQEMFRETNTSGVKANTYEISKRVVDMKNELEKIREQVQNIE